MNTNTFNTMKKTKDRVIWLLQAIPHLRDSDEKLISTYWWYELGKDRTQTFSAFEFMDLYSKGKVTAADNITRCRRKAQEQYPELRGATWKARHTEAEQFSKEVNNL